MGKRTVQERLEIVQRFLAGEPATSIQKQTGMDHNDIEIYALRYQKDGISGLSDKPTTRRRSIEEKLAAVHDYLNESLSLNEIAIKYDTCLWSLKSWMRAYRRGGMEELEDKRFKPLREKLMATVPKGLDKMTNEELQELVKNLSAENALLKKVKALVEKREAPKQEIGSKPSKN